MSNSLAGLLYNLGVTLPRGEARVLLVLRLGLIGSSQKTEDGWIRGRVIPLSEMVGIDAKAAIQRLRKSAKAHGWPIRIITHSLIGHHLEAAPWWAGLRPQPRETRMKYLLAAKTEDGRKVPPVSMHEVTGQLADGRLVGNTRPIAVFYDLSLAERVRDLLDPVHAGAKDKPRTGSDEAGIEPDTLAGDAGAMG